MIKGRRPPRRRCVTECAVLRESPSGVVRSGRLSKCRRVARNTSLRDSSKPVIGVTCGAHDGCVRAGQWKTACGMIEPRSLPLAHRVTGLTIRAESFVINDTGAIEI